MRSFSSADRFGPEDSGDVAIHGFEELWSSGEPSLQQYWSKLDSGQSISTLASLVKIDLQHRFERGQRPKASDYFEAFPSLVESRDRVVSLVYEEFCLLEESGENVDSSYFCGQYAPWRDSLLSQLAYHRELSLAVSAESPSVKYPALGERFGKFQLQSILGTGGAARVYLATEDDLGGRRIALKVSASIGQEPSILANLSHQNIVPILTVTESESGLRGICMPYRPGVTLEEVIKRIGRGTPPKSARAFWDALRPSDDFTEVQSDEQLAGWAGFPIEGTFSEGVAWIGLSLANALFYLHGRGVLHRDVKPANILLAYREGPQLLDFNLAQDPKAPENVQTALKGGTLPYMGPEHLRAFLDPVGWGEVGLSADLYSLGLVLRELVTGRPPVTPGPKLSIPRGIRALIDSRTAPQDSIRDINPNVPPSLESIITKCLEVEPTARYSNASKLAIDLERFLEREPLKDAPNPSIVERSLNWVHRNRSLAIPAFSVLVLVILLFNSTRSPTPIQDTREFRRAVDQLDSNDRADWERAKATFKRMAIEHPRVVWPALYEARAAEKLGYLTEANKIITECLEYDDAEVAIRERLKVEPNSVTLLCLYGNILFNKEQFDDARLIMKRAEIIDPNRLITFLKMGEIELKSHNLPDAIRYYTRAIQVAEEAKLGAEKTYGIRSGLLTMLATKVNQEIDSQPQPVTRKKVLQTLNDLKSTLKALDQDWDNLPIRNGQTFHDQRKSIYESCIASIEAVLAIDENVLGVPSALMAKAFTLLEKTEKLIPTNLSKDEKKFLTSIQDARGRFKRWKKNYIDPFEVIYSL